METPDNVAMKAISVYDQVKVIENMIEGYIIELKELQRIITLECNKEEEK